MTSAHDAHCCARCGCKYAQNEVCPVANGRHPGKLGCEGCDERIDLVTAARNESNLPLFVAGEDIKAGAYVVIGQDGKLHPVSVIIGGEGT